MRSPVKSHRRADAACGALYVGLDVAMNKTAVCLIDEAGERVWQGQCPSSPQGIAAAIALHARGVVRIGMETGPLAVWLWYGLRERELPIVCLHARHAKAALELQHNKTDPNDAHGLAQVVRTGWFRPVELKSMASYRVRLVLATRERLVGTRTSLYNQLRGLLKTFGVILPRGKGSRFVANVRRLTPDDAIVRAVVDALLAHWTAVHEQIRRFDQAVRQFAATDPACRRLMTVPGVGAMTAVAFRVTIDDPNRFQSIHDVAAYLGLTPKRYQSGDVDRAGRITKSGDPLTRTLLFEAAHLLLTRTRRTSALKRWGQQVARRTGHRKATVAVARKLAGILLLLWKTDADFVAEPGLAAA